MPSPRTTTFENVYTAGGREARVTAIAARLELPVEAEVVFLCPVIDEVAPSAIGGRLIGAGLQGWLRRLDEDGKVRRKTLDDVSFLSPCRAVFCSDEDLGDDAALVTRLRDVVPIVVVTHGAAGADLFVDGRTHHVSACPADEVDPTGAGDVFATAFLIALAQGQDPLAAARHGAACAAVVVEGVGPSALTRLARRLE